MDQSSPKKLFSLVIVESPAKAKTINKYLGPSFLVTSSVGHIRDLSSSKTLKNPTSKKPSSGKRVKLTEQQKLAKKLSVDPYNGWKASYQILPGKEKVLKQLKALAKKAQIIYLATDLDREGEAIAWHLRESLSADHEKYKRVIFSEITRSSIKKAFENPGTIQMDRVFAQQTRRYLDRVVGFMLSPLLWQKVAIGLSAGRVQSVAVRLIVEREQEIRAFISETYWEMEASFFDCGDFKAKVTKYQKKDFRPLSVKELDFHLANLNQAQCIVTKKENKINQVKPKAPFITSTLQQAASQRLGFSVKRTMTNAQRLYEAGYITYMRTDSTHISKQALDQCRDHILKKYGTNYLSEKPIYYSSSSNAQEAHEAIRPSAVSNIPAMLANVIEPDQHRLYSLIWSRFIACQMASELWDTTSMVLSFQDYVLRASCKKLKFDGFNKVLGVSRNDDNDFNQSNLLSVISKINQGDQLNVKKLFPIERTTKPKPRFTEAKFVQELEKRGIGRPSTYATIISTIQERGYVKYQDRKFYAQKMGEIVTSKLRYSFADLMDYSFTAKMETQLDEIAQGKLLWKKILSDFFQDFVNKLDYAKNAMPQISPAITTIDCPSCANKMVIKIARTGMFLACPVYQTKSSSKDKDKSEKHCRTTMTLYPSDHYQSLDQKDLKTDQKNHSNRDLDNTDNSNNNQQPLQKTVVLEKCPLCSSPMDSFIVNETTKLHVCTNFPECTGNKCEYGAFKIKGYDGPVIDCDKCSAKMQLKSGRFGKYFACTQCSNTRKLLKNGQVAPPRAEPIPMPELKCEKSDGYFVLRDGAAGIFLASSAFPKSRETKKPKVADLQRHKDKLDDKLVFLATAPAKDKYGNDFVIKFSNKYKHYFLVSYEDKGDQIKKTIKSTKTTTKSKELFTGRFQDNRWDIQPIKTPKNTKSIGNRK